MVDPVLSPEAPFENRDGSCRQGTPVLPEMLVHLLFDRGRESTCDFALFPLAVETMSLSGNRGTRQGRETFQVPGA